MPLPTHSRVSLRREETITSHLEVTGQSVNPPETAFTEHTHVYSTVMCHHFESVTELDTEEREGVLDSHSRAELEAELSDEELEALSA